MSQLGKRLREARIDKGYTLNTLQQLTKIQKKYLQAIEEGKFHEMPGNFYVRAFIKQYADTVGLNGDDLLLEYEDEINEQAISEDEEEDNTELPSRLERFKPSESTSRLSQYIPMVILVVIVGVIILTLLQAIRSIGKDDQVSESQESSVAVVSTISPESAKEKDESKEGEKKDKEEKRDKKEDLELISQPGEETTYALQGDFSDYTFEVEGKGFVWVGLFEDDVVKEDQTIGEGETIDYKVTEGTKTFRIRLGYPEGAIIKVNGKEVPIDNEYFNDTIVFVLADDSHDVESLQEESEQNDEIAEEMSEEATSMPQNESTDHQGYEGPAVLAPDYSREGE